MATTANRPSLQKTKSKSATIKKPRAKATPEKIKADLEAARKKVQQLEQKAYAVEINEQIAKANIIASFNSIKEKLKANKVSDIVILTAIATAVGIKRVEITQKHAAKRTPKAKIATTAK
jgi:hypothetical protein